ncbi:hypothetical protein CFIO01_00022 [Colletotrichum fioriniae PJ7]|uniref:Uncharacterized protein n=1 Tax=Colletotrichum fioriniae PJ7 TaxID=1445577 RepID=A0A010RCD7_9PEZI|nr:hypothetical protein CFIO01_00022 [Colletotrichum fioriniae PJ7]
MSSCFPALLVMANEQKKSLSDRGIKAQLRHAQDPCFRLSSAAECLASFNAYHTSLAGKMSLLLRPNFLRFLKASTFLLVPQEPAAREMTNEKLRGDNEPCFSLSPKTSEDFETAALYYFAFPAEDLQKNNLPGSDQLINLTSDSSNHRQKRRPGRRPRSSRQ